MVPEQVQQLELEQDEAQAEQGDERQQQQQQRGGDGGDEEQEQQSAGAVARRGAEERGVEERVPRCARVDGGTWAGGGILRVGAPGEGCSGWSRRLLGAGIGPLFDQDKQRKPKKTEQDKPRTQKKTELYNSLHKNT